VRINRLRRYRKCTTSGKQGLEADHEESSGTWYLAGFGRGACFGIKRDIPQGK